MKAIKDKIAKDVAKTVEPGIYPDQKDIEAKLLVILATVINGDQADLKYDLLELDESDFHFRDHREIFKTMKALDADGVHVNQTTVRAKLGDAWPETLKTIFDGNLAEVGTALTYKRLILRRANIRQARAIGADFMAKVDQADTEEADLPGLVAGLQKAVFDIARTDRIAPPVKTEADLTDDFILDLANPSPGLKTGFTMLEGIIRGLTPGLFIIAAPPSAGKTTFVKQLADQVADMNEAPVLFFSYEQSAAELRIKSLARLTKQDGKSVPNEDIKEGKESARVEEVAKIYKSFGKRIKVIEGDRQHTVGRIRLMAQREKIITGKPPVLVIDYLQIIPVAEAGKDKRIEIDYLVSDLRRITRDIGSPVIVISAMSRAEYNKIKMSGFKESGGIEYGTDIAAILSVEKEQEEGTERTVKLNIIKNRNGRRGWVGMTYYMKYDYFLETETGFINYMDTVGREGKEGNE